VYVLRTGDFRHLASAEPRALPWEVWLNCQDDYSYRNPAVSPLPSSPLYAMCHGLAIAGTAVSAVTMSKQRGRYEA